MLRTYALRGDVVLRDPDGRESTVTPEDWSGDARWIPALDSMSQPRFVDRETATRVGTL